MPRSHDDDDEPRPRRKRTVADDDQDEDRPSKKIEVRSLSQSRIAPSDEVDDRPKTTSSRKTDDDDDDRPKAKSRRPADDQEDDRPKAKSSRPADDDDDDRPKTKSRRQAVDDDDDRPSRRSRPDYDEDDEPRPKKKKRPPQKQLNVAGLISLIIGIGSLLLSLVPCIGSIALWPGILGVVIGIIGLVIAQKSEGRQGTGLPIAGGSISVAAILIAVGWMVFMNRLGDDFEKELANAEVREKERKEELAKAGPEVKNAQPGSIIQVSANQFYQAYDNDDELADRLYKNKILEVTGTIQEVDFTGEVYILLLRGGPDEFETVDCHFFKDAAVRQQLAALRPGTQVTIRGKCLGEFSTIEACILVR